jgi:hypothetical protein
MKSIIRAALIIITVPIWLPIAVVATILICL